MTGGCPEELSTLVWGWSGREGLPEVVARRQGGRNAYPEVSSEAVGKQALREAGKRAMAPGRSLEGDSHLGHEGRNRLGREEEELGLKRRRPTQVSVLIY